MSHARFHRHKDSGEGAIAIIDKLTNRSTLPAERAALFAYMGDSYQAGNRVMVDRVERYIKDLQHRLNDEHVRLSAIYCIKSSKCIQADKEQQQQLKASADETEAAFAKNLPDVRFYNQLVAEFNGIIDPIKEQQQRDKDNKKDDPALDALMGKPLK